MSVKVAIQMDDPASINPMTDSTMVLAMEAQKRQYQLYYYLPESLSAGSGAIVAQPAYPIQFNHSGSAIYEVGEPQTLNLADMDVVLMRQDPPFDMSYITTTYLLERLKGTTLVVNDPETIRNASEKLSILQFPESIPPTLVTRDMSLIDAFRFEHKDLIVKPLYGYGGRSVFRFEAHDSNLNTLLEEWFANSREPVMLQPYLKEVTSRDVRVIMMNGIVSAAVGRIPAA
ncbi:MAG: glutathione synthase, partial [Rickettsiales bacterium]|nr:glutathione synthase [Rickettsiales bacterium]